MFGPEPSDRLPGVDDGIELDDVFLQGNPLAYFESRIAQLIADPGVPALRLDGALVDEYLQALGVEGGDLPEVDPRDRRLQICLDAFALRQHVAETLIRFIVAVVDARDGKDGSSCLWYHASDSPTQISALLERYRSIVRRSDVDSVLIATLLPVSERSSVAGDASLQQALEVMYAWLNRAYFLLGRSDVNLNGVANKVKHGLAARARDDHRVDLSLEPIPNIDGRVQASVLNGPGLRRFFDAVAVEAIGRVASKEALEQTVLMLRPGPLAAEAHMMALVHAAAFHVASVAHLADRGAFTPPAYPQLPLGPLPEEVHRNALVGSRRPITFRKDGSPTERKRGFANETHFIPVSSLTSLGPLTVVDG